MEEKTTQELVQEKVVKDQDEALFKTIASGEKTHIYTEEDHNFDLVVKFKLPNLKQRDLAEVLYSKKFNSLLKDADNMTVQELLDVAEKRGMWKPADASRLSAIDGLIQEKKALAAEEKNEKKKDKLVKETNELREEKFRLALRVSSITSTGLENLAEKERTIYLLLNCTFVIDEEGNESQLYTSRDEIDNETDMAKFERILIDGKSFWSGEGLSDFLHLGD